MMPSSDPGRGRHSLSGPAHCGSSGPVSAVYKQTRLYRYVESSKDEVHSYLLVIYRVVFKTLRWWWSLFPLGLIPSAPLASAEALGYTCPANDIMLTLLLPSGHCRILSRWASLETQPRRAGTQNPVCLTVLHQSFLFIPYPQSTQIMPLIIIQPTLATSSAHNPLSSDAHPGCSGEWPEPRDGSSRTKCIICLL